MAKVRKKGILPSSNKIVNIKPEITEDNIKLKADKGYFQISYYKNRNQFLDIQTFSKFIKSVERIVRTSDEYKVYISYLKGDIGLDHCMIMQGITDEKATIEMHHGPILTLFDYCAIITDALLKRGEPVSSFIVAKICLQEHFNNNVQVVMLSKTAHQLVHTGKMFVHPSQAWGNLNNFLEEYSDGLTREQIETINEYIGMAENNRTTDNGMLEVSSGVSNWNKQKSEMLDLEEEDEE